MPPSGSHRRQQCAYRERGQRCRRDGTGNPPLCNPHRFVVAEEAKRAEAKENQGAIGQLFDDLFAGRPIGMDKVAQAVHEFAWGMGGNFGANHDIFEIHDDDPYQDGQFQHEHDNRRRPPHERVYGAPPQNEHLEKRTAIRAAKIALGFAASEPITLEQVKKRQRELARQYHPDLPGGSVEKMQAVNAAVDLLEKSL